MHVVVAGWIVGEERELEPGSYACLAAELEGWALWRFETASGPVFTATKAAEGKEPMIPLGRAQALWGGRPAILLHMTSGLHASFRGTHLMETRAEYRVAGDRFMRPVEPRFDPVPFDGKRIEVVVTSMPGPRSFTKVARDSGIIDLAGLGAIIDARDSAT